MCILFFLLDPDAKEDGYEVIIANNRDEVFARPTKTADFWPDNNQCMSGLDMEPGREGGTWLGVSKKGKIACLTNILIDHQIGVLPGRLGRGHLVTDYLKTNCDAMTYAQQCAINRERFSDFNLVLMERRQGKWQSVYYGNTDTNSPVPMRNGIHGISNSILHKPFQKVIHGSRRFEEVVQSHNSVKQKDVLIDQLMELLNNRESHSPDEQIQQQGGPALTGELYEQRCAINVYSPQVNYGTRTNTVILVDKEGRCDYIERTMSSPINPYKPQWQTVQHTFRLSDSLS